MGAASALLGRQADVQRVVDALERARLVTLQGVGGVGKTSVAREVIRHLADATTNRSTCFVDLENARGRGAILRETAAALGAVESPGVSDEERVAKVLAQRHAPLLVLDNLEHLSDAGAVVTALLRRLPELHILATSRLPICVDAEVVLGLQPLQQPTDDGVVTVLDAPATALFIARARGVGRLQVVDGTDARAITRICRRLDGIPLAIELAAARTRLLTPSAIERRLASPARGLLAREAGPQRHRSLDAVLEWTFDLLRNDEQELLLAVSVCPGPFSLASAGILCPGIPTLDVMERLSLAALVQHEPDVGGEPLLRVLATVRESCLARLTDEDLARLEARHVTAMQALVRLQRDAVLGADRAAAVHLLRSQVDNLRAAFDTAIASDPAVAIELIAGIWRFWTAIGLGFEAIARLRLALALERRPSASRAAGLSALAGLLVNLEGRLAGREPAAEAISIARRIREPGIELDALPAAVFAAVEAGEGVAARRMARRAVTLARREGDGRALIRALALQGITDAQFGEVAAGRRSLLESIAEARRQRDPLNEGIQLLNLATMELEHGRPDQAASAAGESADVLERLDAPDYLVTSEAVLGSAMALLGRLEGARQALLGATNRMRAGGMGVKLEEVFSHAIPYLARIGAVETVGHVWGVLRRLEAESGREMPALERLLSEREIARAPWLDPHALAREVVVGTGMDREAALRELQILLDRPHRSSSAAAILGGVRLTPREAQILYALADGLRDAELAARFGISPKTASVHVANVKAKLGVKTRLDAALAGRMLRDGLQDRTNAPADLPGVGLAGTAAVSPRPIRPARRDGANVQVRRGERRDDR